ncbi:alpha/beta fold hydrolase [Nonomuraea antimicrobica]|uniref:Alpha/beta fold hydrolase n=1 Tax=Nonomuraea antimicrobica TaxID=561173 RepID=A0ABP7B5Q8_9ACTN
MTSPNGPAGMWLRRFHDGAGDPQLVCFPHAGGSASYFHQLSGLLSPYADVLTAQYPGRQDRRLEPLIDNIAELADRLAEVLSGHEPGRRRVFFGHSMGSVVAFEVARRLGADGPSWLFASGRRAPAAYRRGEVHLLDDAGLVAEMRRVGGTDPRVLQDEELLAMVLQIVRNDYKAVESYLWTPGEPLNCPITAVVGDRDPNTTIAEASAWAEHTTGPFDLQVMPGGHFYLDTRLNDLAGLLVKAVQGPPRQG